MTCSGSRQYRSPAAAVHSLQYFWLFCPQGGAACCCRCSVLDADTSSGAHGGLQCRLLRALCMHSASSGARLPCQRIQRHCRHGQPAWRALVSCSPITPEAFCSRCQAGAGTRPQLNAAKEVLRVLLPCLLGRRLHPQTAPSDCLSSAGQEGTPSGCFWKFFACSLT